MSQIQHPAILLNDISQNLNTSLEKQLSWAVKACFNRQKSDFSSDFKIKNSVFPIELMLEYRSFTHFWKNQKQSVTSIQDLFELTERQI